MSKIGLWLVGARGGVSTTVSVGLSALAKGLSTATGLITEHPEFANCGLPPLSDFVLGGHEIRRGSLLESARVIEADSGSLPHHLLEAVREDLDEIDQCIKPGILFNSGEAIHSLDKDSMAVTPDSPQDALRQITTDLQEFQRQHQLSGLVVVNLSSTEPPLPPNLAHESAESLRSALERNEESAFRSSTLYSLAAAAVGASFVNFTPSTAALTPATRQILQEANCAYCGSDGKTGETLVKSALAPMFAQRALKVMTWQSYNMLGDRDGEILSHPENRSSKIASKGELIHQILGEDVHSEIRIDYVPSLGDNKTAWDLIHFRGFLDHRMTMQFTWQGCDAILAAPLVIDLARLVAHAQSRGEVGLQKHCSIFFKSPLDFADHALSAQFDALIQKARNW
ncbi:MAG: hypothetical protein CBC13_05180 [Planctomycetia bacterium TMED53]|nr:MAG: hypothetical protein CBC13_05180 [Planctomycetia bacterium TMED53]